MVTYIDGMEMKSWRQDAKAICICYQKLAGGLDEEENWAMPICRLQLASDLIMRVMQPESTRDPRRRRRGERSRKKEGV